jgi:hypothetical protein
MIFSLFVIMVAFIVRILCFPLSRPSIERVVDWSSDWILTDYEEGSSAERMGKKFVGLMIQQSLAAHLHDQQASSEKLGDVARISKHLFAVKQQFIVQSELMHTPTNAPSILSGLAWCDTINGMAAMVLSHDFDRAEIIGVNDKIAGAGHSFGRVWSYEYGDWLYFDIWPEEATIFRSKIGHPAEYLARFRPNSSSTLQIDEDIELIERVHNRAYMGFVHNQLQPNLFGYLSNRVLNYIDHGYTAPKGYFDIIEEYKKTNKNYEFKYKYENDTLFKRSYLKARLFDVFGDDVNSRFYYNIVSKRERNVRSLFKNSAEIFIARGSENRHIHQLPALP